MEPGARPFKEPVRRLNNEKKRIADEQIKEMVKQGIIQRSNSPFASAIVLVKKGDGTYRFCIDFRKLNDITVKDSFPLPRIDESLDKLGSAKYFTSLDMGSAFWQIELTDAAKKRTAFSTSEDLFEWTRMPFGLCNATATFQRLMAQVLRNIKNKHGNLVLCYVDDILIATATIEEHLERIQEVFAALEAAGLKLKASKCNFMDTEIKFLGRKISAKGIQPDPESVQKVQEWDPPRNKNEVASCLGLANYYRNFIDKFAEISAPLNKLRAKNVKFECTEDCQQAFETLKEKLCQEPILTLPNETGKFYLDTDASIVAISGILHQEQEEDGKKVMKVIAYASRGLQQAELNYGAPKLEMLAAIYHIELFQKFLSHTHTSI